VGSAPVICGERPCGASDEGVSTGQAFVVEALITFILVFVVVLVASDPRVPSSRIAAVAVGFAFAAAVFIGGPLTGGGANPARSFGLMLVARVRRLLALHSRPARRRPHSRLRRRLSAQGVQPRRRRGQAWRRPRRRRGFAHRGAHHPLARQPTRRAQCAKGTPVERHTS
jgi:hypothetical protein